MRVTTSAPYALAADSRFMRAENLFLLNRLDEAAKAYGEFATGAHTLGLTCETLEEVTSAADPPPAGTRDAVLKLDALYQFGFTRPSCDFPFGSSHRAFGTPGAGGSFGFADPDHELGFAYVTNRMGFRIFNDPRERAVREAAHASSASSAARRIACRMRV